MEIPNPNKTLTMEECVILYENSMTEADKIAYEIAKKQLESSFDVEKSIGFIQFIKTNEYIIC
tara:strand:+ start:995 stop:1183 length:189 start_codon:yes stop_codon:yes gene_type:complete